MARRAINRDLTNKGLRLDKPQRPGAGGHFKAATENVEAVVEVVEAKPQPEPTPVVNKPKKQTKKKATKKATKTKAAPKQEK